MTRQGVFAVALEIDEPGWRGSSRACLALSTVPASAVGRCRKACLTRDVRLCWMRPSFPCVSELKARELFLTGRGLCRVAFTARDSLTATHSSVQDRGKPRLTIWPRAGAVRGPGWVLGTSVGEAVKWAGVGLVADSQSLGGGHTAAGGSEGMI